MTRFEVYSYSSVPLSLRPLQYHGQLRYGLILRLLLSEPPRSSSKIFSITFSCLPNGCVSRSFSSCLICRRPMAYRSACTYFLFSPLLLPLHLDHILQQHTWFSSFLSVVSRILLPIPSISTLITCPANFVLLNLFFSEFVLVRSLYSLYPLSSFTSFFC